MDYPRSHSHENPASEGRDDHVPGVSYTALKECEGAPIGSSPANEEHPELLQKSDTF